jgi:hypothetical protein
MIGQVSQYERYAHDSEVLAAIGTALRPGARTTRVTLPRGLALAALAAWRRDESEELAQPETPWQAAVRGHAATLALIGLALEQGTEIGYGPVTVYLDEDLIHQALAATLPASDSPASRSPGGGRQSGRGIG